MEMDIDAKINSSVAAAKEARFSEISELHKGMLV